MHVTIRWFYTGYALGIAFWHFALMSLVAYLLLALLWLVGVRSQTRQRPFLHAVLSFFARSLLFFLAIRIRTEYRYDRTRYAEVANAPVRIYVANHLSYMDSLLLMCMHCHAAYPLGKIEIANVPIFGYLYKRYVIPIDRGRWQSKKNSFLRMEECVRAGRSVFVFPEGGFENTPRVRLQPFNAGAFRLALRTGVPIFPIVFLYTYDRLAASRKYLRITAGPIRILYLTPIASEGVDEHDADQLQQKVYREMLAVLEKENYPVL